MDVIATTSQAVALAIGLAGLIGLLLLAWIGGELHYRSCLTEAELRHPVAYQQGVPDSADVASREDAVAGCSRWP
ncbi:MAG TPA: hypothetical protein VFZ41_00390 [Solirubrobacterales bacterium]